jgi:hypothetical protein
MPDATVPSILVVLRMRKTIGLPDIGTKIETYRTVKYLKTICCPALKTDCLDVAPHLTKTLKN